MFSEEEFLQLLDGFFPGAGQQRLRLGRGDDCAVWSGGQDLCITSDLFLEDVHFRRQYFSPADIGYKALAVNVSDVAAMGGIPEGFNLSLMLPENLGLDFWQQLLGGMADLAQKQNILLCGGDLSRASILGLDITIWGRPAGNRFLQRRQCQTGDILFCAGNPGLARVGLKVLESGQGRPRYPAGCEAHLRPRIMLPEAALIAQEGTVRGLMDVSDGLARDLPRFLGPGLGAEIWLQEQDLHQEVLDYANSLDCNPLELALLGGEDYALLGALEPEGCSGLQQKLPELKILGKVLDKPGLRLQGRELELEGFDHFRQ
ncbi:MAG: thiamine-phosphate kinase [Thermodesulfobacteriota bacterium]